VPRRIVRSNKSDITLIRSGHRNSRVADAGTAAVVTGIRKKPSRARIEKAKPRQKTLPRVPDRVTATRFQPSPFARAAVRKLRTSTRVLAGAVDPGSPMVPTVLGAQSTFPISR